MKPEILFNISCELGDGPFWHHTEQGLYWVDILWKQRHLFNPKMVAYQMC